MAEIKEKIKLVWEAITYPDDLDEEYDERCDNAFVNFLDRIVKLCWGVFVVIATISSYLFITREIL